MSYLLLDAVFLAAAAAVAVFALRQRRPGRTGVAAVGIALAALLVLTAVFDTVMIAVGLVAYDPALLIGFRVGLAPLEDFAYPVAAALLLPALWTLLGREHE
ncbi:lycopene cyclase domain-containing protein [Cryobacterium psychrotolerans]|uniref:Lycopene cyclase domain-containing protein n=1 Tax=Cryobacterium psychrotolerans TaxID=386301 RepID=A0A1G8YDX9_9MICO|nr:MULTISPECIES: lycopene cyclase domain-containing protein [Cryobacterium]TFD49168.1 lycopene cyclase domain-containing protein [Cryobacterium sp. TMT1-2-1]TFD90950.1 lycopene cyclase domain-containing protein [Cryobacterium psychrotolerans]SDK00911.1 lycopene cyclase domain-containing protein [Cryobacterium psychrotolerans]